MEGVREWAADARRDIATAISQGSHPNTTPRVKQTNKQDTLFLSISYTITAESAGERIFENPSIIDEVMGESRVSFLTPGYIAEAKLPGDTSIR